MQWMKIKVLGLQYCDETLFKLLSLDSEKGKTGNDSFFWKVLITLCLRGMVLSSKAVLFSVELHILYFNDSL